MPSGFRLAGLQRLAETALPDSAVISRYAVSNTADGIVQTWTTLATVACRVQPLGRSPDPEEIGPSGALTAANRWQISVPSGTDVTVKDRIAVGSRTFEVAEVFVRSYEVIRAVLCREIT